MLERFSVITASVAYEGGVPVFYRWLNDAGIPLLAEERESGSFPVVGMGGALSYINPLVASGVCDFVILGDGMDIMASLVDTLRRYGNAPRKKLWRALADIPSLLVPPLHMQSGENLTIARDLSLDGPYPMHSAWMTPRGTFGKTLLLELQRGCARSCSYCTLPRCFGKMRFRGVDALEEAIDRVTGRFDVPQAGLVTPEAGDYPFLPKLIDILRAKDMGISFASLRLDRLNEKMIEAMTAKGRRSVTVAPETGSERLRFSCGKKFTDGLIIEKLALAREMGIDKVKLYFMTGLPGESDDDITAITELCRRIISETGQSLTLSVNPFIPKPRTAWSGENFAGGRTIRQKYEKIKKDMRSISKKRPQLRLTGVKEAEEEYNLAWYGYDESRELARAIKNGAAAPVSDREKSAALLERFI